MCMYSQGQGKPKWKTLKGSSAKIQAQAVMNGKRARGVTKESKVLLKCRVQKT